MLVLWLAVTLMYDGDGASFMSGDSGGDHVAPSALASVKEEIARKEQQQKQHYLYLSELQSMAQELPG